MLWVYWIIALFLAALTAWEMIRERSSGGSSQRAWS